MAREPVQAVVPIPPPVSVPARGNVDGRGLSARSLEGFGKRLESIAGSSLWVAFRGAHELASSLSPRSWALFVRPGADRAFRYASGAGFFPDATIANEFPKSEIETWPIAKRLEGSDLDTFLRHFSSGNSTIGPSLDAFRFGDRSLVIVDRPVEPRPSGNLEASFAAFGARLDPTLARIAESRVLPGCRPSELGRLVSSRMRTTGASHVVLASFDASKIRDSMARTLAVDPGCFLSLLSRLSSAMLTETGGACVPSGSLLFVHMLTRTPPDPELLSAQFATSLSRAMGGFGKAELPLLRFLVLHDEEPEPERAIAGFLAPVKPGP